MNFFSKVWKFIFEEGRFIFRLLGIVLLILVIFFGRDRFVDALSGWSTEENFTTSDQQIEVLGDILNSENEKKIIDEVVSIEPSVLNVGAVGLLRASFPDGEISVVGLPSETVTATVRLVNIGGQAWYDTDEVALNTVVQPSIYYHELWTTTLRPVVVRDPLIGIGEEINLELTITLPPNVGDYTFPLIVSQRVGDEFYRISDAVFSLNIRVSDSVGGENSSLSVVDILENGSLTIEPDKTEDNLSIGELENLGVDIPTSSVVVLGTGLYRGGISGGGGSSVSAPTILVEPEIKEEQEKQGQEEQGQEEQGQEEQGQEEQEDIVVDNLAPVLSGVAGYRYPRFVEIRYDLVDPNDLDRVVVQYIFTNNPDSVPSVCESDEFVSTIVNGFIPYSANYNEECFWMEDSSATREFSNIQFAKEFYLASLVTRVRAIDTSGNMSDWQYYTPTELSGQIIISEIAWMGTSASPYDEWIELTNMSSEEIDLTGWKIRFEYKENIASTSRVSSLSGVVIPAYGSVILERTNDTTISDITASKIYTGALRNSGDVVILENSDGYAVDRMNFYSLGWPAGDNTAKYTMVRYATKAQFSFGYLPIANSVNAWCSWGSCDSNNYLEGNRSGLDANGGLIMGSPTKIGLRDSVE